MRIAGTYSFNNGREVIEKNYGDLLKEIKIAITSVKEESHKNFESEEPTKRERLLYSPTELNKAFKAEFSKAGGWARMRVPSEYSVSARFYEKTTSRRQ